MHREIDMTNLPGMLQVIGSMTQGRERVSLGLILESIGRRSFGLSLIARDGLIATFAFLFTFGMFGTVLLFIL